MKLSRKTVSDFLHYGYLPSGNSDILDIIRQASENPICANWGHDDAITAQGHQIWKDVIKSELEKFDSGSHIVPLSGGLDSRFVLAGLCDSIERSKITAVTVGTPGMIDYKLGKSVAEEAGVDHRYISLHPNDIVWEDSTFLRHLNDLEQPIRAFDRCALGCIEERFGKDSTIWSGFLGGELAGSHLPHTPINNWADACDRFCNDFSFANSIVPEGYAPADSLPSAPPEDQSLVGYYDQLDFTIRQNDFIYYSVGADKDNVATPFLNKQWVRFLLSAPRALRKEKKLYKRITMNAYPELFSLPTDSDYSLQPSIRNLPTTMSFGMQLLYWKLSNFIGKYAPRPHRSQFDLEMPIRCNDSVKQFFKEKLAALKSRELVPWVDFDQLWAAHQSGSDYEIELRCLVYLELLLEGGCFDQS